MRFLIITHVVHKKVGEKFFGYGPYVKEMNLWFNHVDQVAVVAPMTTGHDPDPIDLAYQHEDIRFNKVPEFNTLTRKDQIKSLFTTPLIFFKIMVEMAKADHIHLRCPGNMGLLGAIAQVFFPWKMKSAKYAGNWDWNSSQPATYRFQQKLITSEFWTKNMQVLIYGTWEPMTRNLKSFFTATYSKSEITPCSPRELNGPLRLVFIGGLLPGKRPLISCESLKLLVENGIDARLDLYGEGPERESLEKFIASNGLENHIILKGNQPSHIIKEAFQNSHFLIFTSESEGWPKVVAESMFWGCLPITTAVSCVPEMVGHGSRGLLVNPNPIEVFEQIKTLIDDPQKYHQLSQNAMNWSRVYTLEKFDEEIKNVLAS
ncbi:glycosyltransferase [Algoriphagus machipongonensis]|uniref:Glycosyl transferase n=1 Tax=Algoriphagus machipongonensis TaxID=388413 RepID=A3I1Z3_9BACT|nr:glycosyltransferase [Algoriphagus machipongonensis]EAZ79809.1 glycosyl transferase [Algoriphagus machipongonensis]